MKLCTSPQYRTMGDALEEYPGRIVIKVKEGWIVFDSLEEFLAWEADEAQRVDPINNKN